MQWCLRRALTRCRCSLAWCCVGWGQQRRQERPVCVPMPGPPAHAADTIWVPRLHAAPQFLPRCRMRRASRPRAPSLARRRCVWQGAAGGRSSTTRRRAPGLRKDAGNCGPAHAQHFGTQHAPASAAPQGAHERCDIHGGWRQFARDNAIKVRSRGAVLFFQGVVVLCSTRAGTSGVLQLRNQAAAPHPAAQPSS